MTAPSTPSATKDPRRQPPSAQVLALDEQIAALERNRASQQAALDAALAERPAAEARHAAALQEVVAAETALLAHRQQYPTSRDFYDNEGTLHRVVRDSDPRREAALADVDGGLVEQWKDCLEGERDARVVLNAIGLRQSQYKSAIAYAEDQLGQLRQQRETLRAQPDEVGALKRIRDGLAALSARVTQQEPDIRKVRLTQTYWYTADRSEVVGDGDPRSAYLLGRKGTVIEIDQYELERVGVRAAASAGAR